MEVSEFKDVLDRLAATNSRNDKKDIIREASDDPAAISFLSGSEYDDVGVAKKTVHKVAQEALSSFEAKPTVSEALDRITTQTSQEGSKELSMLRGDMEQLAKRSGNDMEGYLFQMFAEYDYPSVVAHACLNDWPTGVSDTTIANALDLRDSLPFYESVVDAVEVSGEPLTEPVVHKPFDPMLAKSESSLPDSLDAYVGQPKVDGYRLIIHTSGQPSNQEITAFTRRRNDVTESLPELQEIDFPAGDWIVDCEVIAETGSYSDTSRRIGRKAENVSRDVEMEFAIFDVIKKGNDHLYGEPFINRYGWTVTFADLTPDERVGALPIFTDEERAKAAASEYEGIIWKKLDGGYRFGKRSSNWVKQKHQSENVDVVAADFVEGEGRLDGTLGKVVIESADGICIGATGSGFSDEQRDEIWNNRDEYLNEPLEVEAEAFGERGGLRFPIFQRWRSDDGEPDTLERIEEIMPET